MTDCLDFCFSFCIKFNFPTCRNKFTFGISWRIINYFICSKETRNMWSNKKRWHHGDSLNGCIFIVTSSLCLISLSVIIFLFKPITDLLCLCHGWLLLKRKRKCCMMGSFLIITKTLDWEIFFYLLILLEDYLSKLDNSYFTFPWIMRVD